MNIPYLVPCHLATMNYTQTILASLPEGIVYLLYMIDWQYPAPVSLSLCTRDWIYH